jgi:hypothetical protein
MNKAKILADASFFSGRKFRFWKVGMIDNAIKEAAGKIPVELDIRIARMDLASDVFGGKIESYNDLTGGQLHALYLLVTIRSEELKQWMTERYGRQLSML